MIWQKSGSMRHGCGLLNGPGSEDVFAQNVASLEYAHDSLFACLASDRRPDASPKEDVDLVGRLSPFKNLLSLKEFCTLVNADLGNIGEPANMLKVLREKAPLS